MNNYKLNFDVWKEDPDIWAQRTANHLINIIGACRTGQFMKFNSYGMFRYEDDDAVTKWHPIVVPQESYSKKSSSCLIFDINIPNCPYDKCFVYHYTTRLSGYAGFYLYSTEHPEEHIHKYYIENNLNTLVVALNRMMYDLSQKYDKKEINIKPYRYHDRWA